MNKTILEIPENPNNFSGEHRHWSASTLNEVEECPKKFALRRTSYPSIWARSGFPNRITASQIKGTVVHEVVSKIMTAVQESNLSPAESVMAFLKKNGGYGEILKAALEKELHATKINPRAEMIIDSLRKEIMAELGELRGQAQFFVKTSISKINRQYARPSSSSNGTFSDSNSEIRHINSEFKIVDNQYPIEGYLDLLIINQEIDHIIDYKTSKIIHPEYWEQLKIYAWLWNRNSQNQKKSDCKIEIISGSNSSSATTIKKEEFPRIETEILKRLESAELSISNEIKGIPSDEACKFCPVKVLCKDYWNLAENRNKESKWSDQRVKVLANLGGNAWKVQVYSDDSIAILVVGNRDDGTISSGQELRLLNIYINQDEETGTVMRLSQNSEVFRVVSN